MKTALFTLLLATASILYAGDSDLNWQPLERHAIINLVNFQEIITLDEQYNIVQPEYVNNQPKNEPARKMVAPKPIAAKPESILETKPVSTPRQEKDNILPSYQSSKLKLERAITINLSDITLIEAIDYIADKTQVSILTNWNELELLNVSRDDTISLTNIQTISAAKALDTVLQYVSPGNNINIGYKIDEEGIVYVKQVQPDHYYRFKTYYIGDLVRPIDNMQNNYNRSGQNNYQQNNGQQNNNRNQQQNNNW